MKRSACRTKFSLFPVLLGAFAVVALLVGIHPAMAGQVGPSKNACMQPVFSAAGGSGLQCTANDVTISVATPTAVNGTACGGQGEPDCECEEDTTISVDLDITYQLSGGGSNKTRYDLGAYFDVSGDGINGARTGKCIHATLQPSDSGYYSAPGEPVNDVCGDIDTAHNPLTTHIQLTGVKCVKAPNSEQLLLPYCLSWRQPGSNELCGVPTEAAGPDTNLHTDDDIITTDAFPGAPSKCRCDDFFAIAVTVTPPPTGSGLKCAVGAVRGCTIVRYEVQVNATAGGSDTSVTVESITDNTVDPTTGNLVTGFGNVTALSGNDTTSLSVRGTTCGQASGGNGLGTLDGVQGAGILPATTPYTCRFDGVICGAPGNHTNQITANLKGHPSNQTSTFPDNPNDSTNTPTEGRVTIGVNNITGVGTNICPTPPSP
jgi:hypothetical protein